MTKLNETKGSQVTEFILMSLTNDPELKGPLFVVFLLNYMATVVGNLGLIILTSVDSHLQTPMYFFLRHLAYVDLGYSTVIGPKMLASFIVEENTISYNECATQFSFYAVFITSEFFILSAMAYDRYVAICKPLLYIVIMSNRVCWVLVVIPYLYGIMVSLLVTIKIFNSSFCASNVMRQFFCDSVPALYIICSDIRETKLIIKFFAAFDLISSLSIVLVSYMLIIVAILRMNSSEGRHKAFFTCGSHLIAVVLFYATLLFIYLKPQSSYSVDTEKIATLFYTLVIPMFNPLIYSLRNKEVKDAFKRVFKKLI
ncbi:olfactory receptor 8K1-like [Gracilinanus agilis]|uniref:olfactory receptor 8K1-like n=1 Tax=Gracilinanus agilis TaxID=191870 RepID=UPI001CFC49A7|nr:olfactory receptor 8K1-like [Gracilinanus agilis]